MLLFHTSSEKKETGEEIGKPVSHSLGQSLFFAADNTKPDKANQD